MPIILSGIRPRAYVKTSQMNPSGRSNPLLDQSPDAPSFIRFNCKEFRNYQAALQKARAAPPQCQGWTEDQFVNTVSTSHLWASYFTPWTGGAYAPIPGGYVVETLFP
jgi:hypothetical protein